MSNSPVFIFLKDLIKFDACQPQPLYVQGAQQIVNAIQRGMLTTGTKLPGTRMLGKLAGVNRNTAVAIYDELASQGWIEIMPNKGTFVLAPKKENSRATELSKEIHKAYQYPSKTAFSFESSLHLSPSTEYRDTKYTINDGAPDLRLHPMHQLMRWYTASIKRKSLIDKWNRPTDFSASLFYQEVCNHLNVTRGFYINPNHILTTRSTEMSLYIVSQLLLKPKDLVLVGTLSNYRANMTFQQVGATIKTVPIDEEGLDVDAIEHTFQPEKIRCIYLSPQRNYPTTVTLSVSRRLKLLRLAKRYGFAIIEDDYDYDFQYDGYAMPPMAASDTEGVVIYLGKLGQGLFPSFQIGFVVAPQNLVTEARNYLQIIDDQGDYLQEQLLTELIREGEIYRLIKKNNVIYKERRDHLLTLLNSNFQHEARWNIPSGGLAIWLEFKYNFSLIQLSREASKLDLFLPKTVLYQNKNTCAIRLGFGHLNLDEISSMVNALQQAYVTVKAI